MNQLSGLRFTTRINTPVESWTPSLCLKSNMSMLSRSASSKSTSQSTRKSLPMKSLTISQSSIITLSQSFINHRSATSINNQSDSTYNQLFSSILSPKYSKMSLLPSSSANPSMSTLMSTLLNSASPAAKSPRPAETWSNLNQFPTILSILNCQLSSSTIQNPTKAFLFLPMPILSTQRTKTFVHNTVA